MSNPVEELKKQAFEEGIGESKSANVIEVSKAERQAVKNLIESSQMDRKNYSMNSKVTTVVVMALAKKDIAVEGVNAMGTIKDPDKAMRAFRSKTGMDDSGDTIKFTKLHSEQSYEGAMQMYNLLKAAQADPTMKVKPFLGKVDAEPNKVIKGVVIEEPNGAQVKVPYSKLPNHILHKGFMVLNVDSKSKGQFQLDTPTGDNKKRPYIVKVANKKNLMEDESVLEFAKKIVKEVSDQNYTFTSEMCVICNSARTDKAGNPVKQNFRIPLHVPHWKIQVVEGCEEFFGTGISRNTEPISLGNEDDAKKLIAKMNDVLAAAYASSDKALDSKLRAAIDAEKEQLKEKEAEAVNSTLGSNVSPSDFE